MPFSNHSSGEEVDMLTTSVSLSNGVSTNEVEVDLRSQETKTSGSLWGNDFTDSCKNPVKVSTYMKGREPVSDKIQIFVQTVNAGTKTFNISKNLTVADLKDMITKVAKINQNDYYLTYQGSPLENQCRLSSYGIGNNCTLRMGTRCRGG